MDGESAAIWCPATSDEARQLRRLLVAAGRWHRAGIAGAASVIVWAASSLMLIALAFAVAAGLLPPGQRDAAAVLLLAAGGAALGFAVVVLLPVYIPQAAELVQERLGICDDIIITAAEAAGGRACGSHRFLSAVTRQAVASLGSFQPAVLFLTGPWRIGISAAWLAAFLFALTFAIPDAWRLVGQDRPARVLPAPVLPTSLPSRRVGPGTPELVHFSLRIDPPPYTGREPVVFRAPSSVTAPVGSRVQISAQFSGCESAQLSWSAGPAAAQGRDGIFAELTLIRATSWTISARGPGGHKQLGPFAIRLIPDRPPSARIVSPSGDVRMDSPGPLELSVEAADDYGLTRLALQYRTLRERTWRDIDLQAAGRTVHLRSMLDLRPMELGTGDTLLVRLAATDNNAVSRPATTYSSTLRVSLSPDIKRAASRPVSEIHEMA
ncbi:MAG: DUF4175 family protein, partial [Armatimonadetes bacterium]|nr:DUF4175 family protein [Armatimonadota bacterium]